MVRSSELTGVVHLFIFFLTLRWFLQLESCYHNKLCINGVVWIHTDFAIMSTLEHEIVNADRITMITGGRLWFDM